MRTRTRTIQFCTDYLRGKCIPRPPRERAGGNNRTGGTTSEGIITHNKSQNTRMVPSQLWKLKHNQEIKTFQRVGNKIKPTERSATVLNVRPCWQLSAVPLISLFYHLPASLPPAQIRPPPLTGTRRIHVPISQINLRYRRCLCKRRSFRCRRGSFKVEPGSARFWADCVWGGRMIDKGFRM